MIYEYFDFVKQNGYFDYRRNEQSKYWMYESINEHLRLNFYNNALIRNELPVAERSVLAGLQTSFTAAQGLLDEYFKQLSSNSL
jgi:LAO/AO transport system kinase